VLWGAENGHTDCRVVCYGQIWTVFVVQ
jgi:hypothetical protein